MSQSVCTDLAYVEPGTGGCCCKGGTPPLIFRTVWDRLVQQMFGPFPPGTDTEEVLPDVTIWEDGVTLVEEQDGSYSFNVTTSDGTSPQPYDAILYQGKFYIIGEVE